jgi:hypothetical protein
VETSNLRGVDKEVTEYGNLNGAELLGLAKLSYERKINLTSLTRGFDDMLLKCQDGLMVIKEGKKVSKS